MTIKDEELEKVVGGSGSYEFAYSKNQKFLYRIKNEIYFIKNVVNLGSKERSMYEINIFKNENGNWVFKEFKTLTAEYAEQIIPVFCTDVTNQTGYDLPPVDINQI